ncbi:ammonia-forming cytochrome c nitrite reductase subunit c552 [Eggerthellaceae bacterium zg-1084]|uniref:ammonia-forming cytochrome c nitrite reductase subunit c552 n=1 Tax=Berryella wangjianweii TaxID=2734634 RepID=UPI0015534FD7|nr:ammonia-forming cytochrome c nitrite reductase subunit c552 [Berryella wangjianweii]NPD30922.1 ammonia-forming cytochrome c nitrite reductase subunit c552 [Berryella wangjianweii]
MAVLVGCSPRSGSTSKPAESDSTTSMAAYKEAFPLQYSSLQGERIDEKGLKKGHSINILRDICEAPLARDRNGDILYNEDGTVNAASYEYDEKTKRYVLPELSDQQLKEMALFTGCLSCKTSKFNDLYEKQGASAFGSVYNADAKSVVDGEYFDCGMCHSGSPSAGNVSANLMYFKALGEGFAEGLDPKTAVCGQCHNSYDYRSSIKTEGDLQKFRPYRYGTDMESLFKANYEDGVNFSVDKETGIATCTMVHPIVELFQNSPMAKLGVTCVSCHMPKTTDQESGSTYTNHFAANNPLESEDSLKYCLTCHENQGIGSTDEMKSFVQQKASGLAAAHTDLKAKTDSFLSALETAIKSEAKDSATLDQARELYAKATWFERCINTQPTITVGNTVAMSDSAALVAAGNAACDEGMALLS